MKAAFLTLVALAIAVGAGLVAYAEEDKDKKDDKEVTLKGELGCPKCVFKLDKKIHGGKCGNAIEVKSKDDKKVIYVFIDKGRAEEYHKPICTERKKGQVMGKVSKKDDQLYLTPKKDSVKYDD